MELAHCNILLGEVHSKRAQLGVKCFAERVSLQWQAAQVLSARVPWEQTIRLDSCAPAQLPT